MLADNQNVNIPKILGIAGLVTASAVIHASIYSLNFMIFPDLAPELDISGTAFGVLAGIGLIVAFVLFLIPMGTYVESWDKRTLIIGGLLLKMFFGALQSVAWDFWSLLLIRFGLAVGFATSFVPCLSLLAQLDSGSEFGVGISYTILATGPYLGFGLASWAGILSYLYGWQTTFGLYGFMCGLEAFVVILLVPQDKGMERMWAAQEGLLTVWLSKTVPALLTAAGSLRLFAWFATVAYLPIYFQRFVVSDSAAVPAISLWLGTAVAMAGCGGVASGSLTTALLLDYAHLPAAPAFVAAAGSFLAVPPLLLALFAPVETWLVLVLLFLSLLLGEVWIGPATFMTQVCLPEHLRAAGATVFLILCALLGSAALPVVGLLLDLGLPLRPVLAAALTGSHAAAGVAFVLVGLLSPNGFQQHRDEDAGEPDDDFYDAPAAAAGRPAPAVDSYVRRQPQGYQEVGAGAGGPSTVQVMV